MPPTFLQQICIHSLCISACRRIRQIQSRPFHLDLGCIQPIIYWNAIPWWYTEIQPYKQWHDGLQALCGVRLAWNDIFSIIDIDSTLTVTYYLLAGHSETSLSFAWFLNEPRTFVTGMNNKLLRIYDLRGQSIIWLSCSSCQPLRLMRCWCPFFRYYSTPECCLHQSCLWVESWPTFWS